tara:strand:+ start:2630 stop:3352 length:723 start_codon:yes stop_codon:yes gene_type:complete
MNPSVLILGAKGDIAKEIAKVYALHGYDLILSGRKIIELEGFAQDLRRSGVVVELKELDITNVNTFQDFISKLKNIPTGIIVGTGFNPPNSEACSNLDKFTEVINVNYTGPMAFINSIKNKMKQGFIIGISSVAGERGRKNNYIYGSAKSGFSTYLSGLRQELYSYNVNVITVHPGFVKTKMTKNIKTIGFLTTTPDKVALDIFKGQQGRKDIIYSKFYWKYIMIIIKLIPESIFKKLHL